MDFSEPIGWEVVDPKEYLQDLLSHRVDLILKGGVLNRPRLLEAMKRDMVYVDFVIRLLHWKICGDFIPVTGSLGSV